MAGTRSKTVGNDGNAKEAQESRAGQQRQGCQAWQGSRNLPHIQGKVKPSLRAVPLTIGERDVRRPSLRVGTLVLPAEATSLDGYKILGNALKTWAHALGGRHVIPCESGTGVPHSTTLRDSECDSLGRTWSAFAAAGSSEERRRLCSCLFSSCKRAAADAPLLQVVDRAGLVERGSGKKSASLN